MPLVFLFFAAALGYATLQNEQTAFFQMLKEDIYSGGFLAAAAVIMGLYFASGSPAFAKPAKLFAGLVLLAMILANGGVWSQLTSAISSPVQPGAAPAPPAVSDPTINIGSSSSSGGAGGAAGAVGTALGVAKSILPFLG